MLVPLLALSLAVAPPIGPRIVTITSESQVVFHPNQVVMSFNLATPHRDQTGAKKANDEKLRGLLAAWAKAGVDGNQLTYVEAAASPDYRGNEVIGWIGVRNVSVVFSDLNRIDEAITAALKSGATLTGGVALRNTEHQLYENQARIAAAKQARERANGMMQALGAKAGLPATLSESTPAVWNVAGAPFMAAADGTVTTHYALAELTATSHVTVQFDIEPP